MLIGSFFLAAAAVQAAPAAQAAPTAAQNAQPTAQQMEAALRAQGFSDAGIRTLTAQDTAAVATLRRLAQDMQRVGQELSTAMAAAAPDPALIGPLLRRGDALNAEVASLRTAQMIKTLTALSPADRKLFINVLAAPRQQGQQTSGAPR